MDRGELGSAEWDQATYWQRHVEERGTQSAQPGSSATPTPTPGAAERVESVASADEAAKPATADEAAEPAATADDDAATDSMTRAEPAESVTNSAEPPTPAGTVASLLGSGRAIPVAARVVLAITAGLLVVAIVAVSIGAVPIGAGSTAGQPVSLAPSPIASSTLARMSTASPTLPTTLTIPATTVLDRGQSFRTSRTRLVMENAGDLAVYDEDNVRRWTSGTTGDGHRAVFQDDGNLVVYDQKMAGLWTSGTAGRGGAVLVLGADGDVSVVYRGRVIWASNTAH